VGHSRAVGTVSASPAGGGAQGGGGRAGHACARTCGKALGCGKADHVCDNACHARECGPCGHVDNAAPTQCACGAQSIAAPVRCGTLLPQCGNRCPLPRACGHAHAAWHTCHPREVPCEKPGRPRPQPPTTDERALS